MWIDYGTNSTERQRYTRDAIDKEERSQRHNKAVATTAIAIALCRDLTEGDEVGIAVREQSVGRIGTQRYKRDTTSTEKEQNARKSTTKQRPPSLFAVVSPAREHEDAGMARHQSAGRSEHSGTEVHVHVQESG